MPLNHTAALVTIATPNFDRLVEFYTQLLTQSPITCIPNVYAEFHLPGVKLGIFYPKGEGREETEDRRQKSEEYGLSVIGHRSLESKGQMTNDQEPPSPSPSSTPFSLLPSPFPSLGMSLCLEVESLDAAIAHLSQLGCPPPGNILTASHGREIYAYDPDGNWLILHQSYSANDLKH